MRLRGKVALITGAGRGMGRAACRIFAREGAGIIALDIDERPCRETVALVEEAGGQIVFFQCDVSSEEQVKRAIKDGAASFGRLDVLYNNAGVLWPDLDGELTSIDEETWDRVQAVNLKGTLWTCKYGIREMVQAGGGSIVNVSSVAAHRFDTNHYLAAYASSKAAVTALTKALAIAHAKDNIRANVILPGPVDTTLTGPLTDEYRETVGALIPLGRIAQPDEIVNLALFLASEEASYITGAEIPVDGGILAHLGW